MGMARATAVKPPRMEQVCKGCGYRTPRWLGRCPECGVYDAFEAISVLAARAGLPAGAQGCGKPLAIDRIALDAGSRDSTGIGEFDRALGGGLVSGMAVLLAGDPGIGKSTLLLTAMDRLSQLSDKPALYVSGEESLRQIRLRGERLGTLSPRLLLYSETNLNLALAAARELQPRVLAVDSVQCMAIPELPSAAGSISQVREVSGRLVEFAKESGIPVLLVGHVTKDGQVAGPRVLEHMVDTVLYFEGDKSHAYRILRAHKNRFGSTNEIGVFEMKAEGLCEVSNPSALLLAERPEGSSGSAVVALVNGTRPLLVEVQALVADSAGPGTARRAALGVDGGRVALLCAVLEKKEGLLLSDKDIYVNVAGGAELAEPAGDLAVLAALCSSARDQPLDARTVVLGEVGLSGEVRAVSQIEPRLAEAAQLGFTRCVLPRGNARRLGSAPLELIPADTVPEAIERLFG
jgi:DNA repair protein RadA/Sms